MGIVKLFVYGSLKRGKFLYENTNYNCSIKDVQPATMKSHKLYKIKGVDFPIMVKTINTKDVVYGEYHAHKISEKENYLLSIVDHMEGCAEKEEDSLFFRKKGYCQLDGYRKQVYYYVWPHGIPTKATSILKW